MQIESEYRGSKHSASGTMTMRRAVAIASLWLLLVFVFVAAFMAREWAPLKEVIEFAGTPGVAAVLGVAAIIGLALSRAIWSVGRGRQSPPNQANGTKAGASLLQNRDTLIRAVANYMSASQELIMRHRELNARDQTDPHHIHVEERAALDEAKSKFNTARAALDRERLVAGEPYREAIMDYIALVFDEYERGKDLMPGDIRFDVMVQAHADKLARQIDEIANQGKKE